MAKKATPIDEKFEKIDFDLFEALAAIDRKDYGYYDRLSPEQKQKFNPYMMIKWFSYVTTKNSNIEQFYVLSTNHYANKHLFNEKVYNHPKLIWLMLCASSPKQGTMRRAWIPQIREKIASLKEKSTKTEIKEYYTKTYPNTDKETINEIAEVFTDRQHKKVLLAEYFPNMKIEDIELLAALVNETELENYAKDLGS